MCGIAGAWVSETTRRVDPLGLVAAMVDALRHRGPDGRGQVLCTASDADAPARIALGHTRLAIIDLSDRAAQPMKSERLPIWVTFNGEIYNFRELGKELETRGRVFRTTSDSEVILQGFEEWGEDVFNRLQGMFALGIWDGRRHELVIARDRVGIKPLYWHRSDSGVLFASEIRALLATDVVPRRVDRVAVAQYLAHQTVPAPRTLVADVRMLQPGHRLTIRADGDINVRQYWDMLDSASSDAAHHDATMARQHVADLLSRSIALHHVSDVPVGIFLSGGIDSSALVSLTRQLGVVPNTFSIILPGTPHDEARFASSVARTFRAEHTEIPLSEDDFREQLPEATAAVDHPSGDGLNSFVIARAVRGAGLKVALSGLGGDEVFGGYPSFGRLRRLAGYRGAWSAALSPIRNLAAKTVRALGRSSIEASKAAAVLESDGTMAEAFPVLRQLFGPAERLALLGRDLTHAEVPDPYEELLREAMARHPQAGLMSQVSYAESRTYMHDVLLRDTDQMSMAHALEVRVPLLDHALIEYVMGLPDDVKAPGAVPKRLLVESLGAALPPECVNRPKQGFVLPFDTWMKGDLRAFCEHHLGSHGLAGRGIVQTKPTQELWQRFLSGSRTTTWSRPWALVALNAWLERTGVAS